MRLSVEYVATSSLRPFKSNARTHPKKQIRQIADSISAFGFNNPILVDEKDEIIAGHGRFLGAQLLDLQSVPVIRLRHLSEMERRAYIIADNAIASRSLWNLEMLSSEVKLILENEVPFKIETIGFDTLEIDKLIRPVEKIETGEEVMLPDLKKPAVSRRGDLFIAGDHRILCGDAKDAADYALLMGSELASMAISDPPYGVPIKNNVSRHHDEFIEGAKGTTPEQLTQLLRSAFQNIRAFTVPGAIVDIFMDWRHQRNILDAADGVFLKLMNLAVWAKSNAGLGSFYRSAHELVYIFKASEGQHQNNFGLGAGGRHRSNIWQYPGVNAFRPGRKRELELHATVKPKLLVADAILDCSRPREIILDPFLGSGTCAVAAEAVGRRCFGMELDGRFVDVCLRRLEEEAGIVARLSTGETFAELKAKRAIEGGDL